MRKAKKDGGRAHKQEHQAAPNKHSAIQNEMPPPLLPNGRPLLMLLFVPLPIELVRHAIALPIEILTRTNLSWIP